MTVWLCEQKSAIVLKMMGYSAPPPPFGYMKGLQRLLLQTV